VYATLFEDMTLASEEKHNLGEIVAPIAGDVGKITSLHGELLRSEVKQSFDEAIPALVGFAAGAGLALAGGLLGSLALVHGLHRSTRLPIWGCYGLVGGMLGVTGVGLMGMQGRRLSAVNFIPHETLAVLKEDLQWVEGKTK
jgi:hypothetical protein